MRTHERPTSTYAQPPPDAEVLIQEARRLRRRRWLAGLVVVLVAIGGSGLGYGIAASGGVAANRRTGPTTNPASRPVGATSALVVPKSPGALAVGPNGNLYLADISRNQILERLSSGRFKVVAGNGKRGFAGDGGPATAAELDDPGGMTITANGTIYFADEDNNRVRMIAPNGTISTVAGDGKSNAGVPNGTPAIRAPLAEPSDVVVGPSGELYIAAYGYDQVLRLDSNGRLHIVAGPAKSKVAGATGIGGPATKATPDGPNGLAFDGAGDLYISGNNSKTLLMIDTKGIMRLVISPQVGFYPRDGGLVTGPRGAVFATNNQQLVKLSPTGQKVVFNFGSDRLLGKRGGAFLPGGIAIAPNGAIYTDTASGNGYANTSAIVSVSPGHQPRILWNAAKKSS